MTTLDETYERMVEFTDEYFNPDNFVDKLNYYRDTIVPYVSKVVSSDSRIIDWDIINALEELMEYLGDLFERLRLLSRGSKIDDADTIVYDFIVALSQLIDEVNISWTFPIHIGFSDDNVRNVKPAYITHKVSQNETLEDISEIYFGTPDEWSTIADDNDIEDVEQLEEDGEWIGRELSIRIVRPFADRITGVRGSNEGMRGLGKDLENPITYRDYLLNEDRDIATISNRETFLEGVKVIIENGVGTFPEDSTFGSTAHEILGRGYGSFTDLFVSKGIERSASQDPTIETMITRKLEKREDNYYIEVSVVPVGVSIEELISAEI